LIIALAVKEAGLAVSVSPPVPYSEADNPAVATVSQIESDRPTSLVPEDSPGVSPSFNNRASLEHLSSINQD